MRRFLLALAVLCLILLLARFGSVREENSGSESAEQQALFLGCPVVLPAARQETSMEAPAPNVDAGRRKLVPHTSGGCVAETCQSWSLRWMIRNQNADGSWGGEAEIFEGQVHTQATATALVLLSIESMGYTTSSTATVEGRNLGEAIRAAMTWLNASEAKDPLESALAALVNGEMYGLTNGDADLASAQSAFDRLSAFQRPDGSFGDPAADAWAGVAMFSARDRNLREENDEATGRIVRHLGGVLDREPGAPAAAAYVLLSKDRAHEALSGISGTLAAARPDWEHPEFTRWYFGTFALMQIEGPNHVESVGETWKAWGEALKEALISTQERKGGWSGLSGRTGEAVRNAMGTLALEVYYRYSSAIATK